MSKIAKLRPVTFHGDTLYLVQHKGEPYAPVRQICEQMGLTWQSQQEKIKLRFSSTATFIVSVASDGKRRNMLCLPLAKIPAWLYTISSGRVSPALRVKVETYQNECDDALWTYWTQGHATRPPNPRQAALPGIIATPARTGAPPRSASLAPPPLSLPPPRHDPGNEAVHYLSMANSLLSRPDTPRAVALHTARAAVLRAAELLTQADNEARHE